MTEKTTDMAIPAKLAKGAHAKPMQLPQAPCKFTTTLTIIGTAMSLILIIKQPCFKISDMAMTMIGHPILIKT